MIKMHRIIYWLKTDGQITSSSAVSAPDWDLKNGDSALIEYCYHVKGKEYTSNRIDMGLVSFRRAE